MKNFMQAIYSYRNVVVIDPDTKCTELACYQMLFGIPFKITYQKLNSNK